MHGTVGPAQHNPLRCIRMRFFPDVRPVRTCSLSSALVCPIRTLSSLKPRCGHGRRSSSRCASGARHHNLRPDVVFQLVAASQFARSPPTSPRTKSGLGPLFLRAPSHNTRHNVACDPPRQSVEPASVSAHFEALLQPGASSQCFRSPSFGIPLSWSSVRSPQLRAPGACGPTHVRTVARRGEQGLLPSSGPNKLTALPR